MDEVIYQLCHTILFYIFLFCQSISCSTKASQHSLKSTMRQEGMLGQVMLSMGFRVKSRYLLRLCESDLLNLFSLDQFIAHKSQPLRSYVFPTTFTQLQYQDCSSLTKHRYLDIPTALYYWLTNRVRSWNQQTSYTVTNQTIWTPQTLQHD